MIKTTINVDDNDNDHESCGETGDNDDGDTKVMK